MVSLGIVMVTSWMTTIYISVWHQYKARIQEPFEMFDPLYDKPWSRIGPYLIGKDYLHIISESNMGPNIPKNNFETCSYGKGYIIFVTKSFL